MRAVVTGVGHHLPERVVTTAEVEAIVAERGGFRLPSGIVQLLTVYIISAAAGDIH